MHMERGFYLDKKRGELYYSNGLFLESSAGQRYYFNKNSLKKDASKNFPNPKNLEMIEPLDYLLELRHRIIRIEDFVSKRNG